MNPEYDDITSRIAEPPSFWQKGGVPRWGGFTPDASPSIYADEVALAEIACQSCGTRFHVCFHQDRHERRGAMREAILDRSLHYGDPPNTGCCLGGASMNSVPLRVLEYWHRSHEEFVVDGQVYNYAAYAEWRREADLEISIRPSWARPEDDADAA